MKRFKVVVKRLVEFVGEFEVEAESEDTVDAAVWEQADIWITPGEFLSDDIEEVTEIPEETA